MTATKKAVFISFPTQLDPDPIRAFLVKQNVDPTRADDMAVAIKLLIARYEADKGTSARTALLSDLEGISKAADKLADALWLRAGLDDAWSAIAEAYTTNPGGVRTDADAQNAMRLAGQWRDRMGHHSQFLANVILIREAAKDAISRRTKPGRPIMKKSELIPELAILWCHGTGERPKASNSTTWENPTTVFAKFIKLAVQMLPLPLQGEFKIGFPDAIATGVKSI